MRLLGSEGWKRAPPSPLFFQVRFQNQYQRLAAHGNCDFGCRYAYAISALFFSAPTLLSAGRLLCLSGLTVSWQSAFIKRARKERERPLRAKERDLHAIIRAQRPIPKHIYARAAASLVLFLSALSQIIWLCERKYWWCCAGPSLIQQITCLIHRERASQMIHYYIPSLWYSAPDFDQTNDNNFCHKTHLSSLWF